MRGLLRDRTAWRYRSGVADQWLRSAATRKQGGRNSKRGAAVVKTQIDHFCSFDGARTKDLFPNPIVAATKSTAKRQSS